MFSLCLHCMDLTYKWAYWKKCKEQGIQTEFIYKVIFLKLILFAFHKAKQTEIKDNIAEFTCEAGNAFFSTENIFAIVIKMTELFSPGSQRMH